MSAYSAERIALARAGRLAKHPLLPAKSDDERRLEWHEAYLRSKQTRRDLCACGATKMRSSPICRSCRNSTPRPVSDLAARLWPKVDRSAGDAACWPFTGARMHNGYGMLGLGRRTDPKTAAHRVAWTVAVGPIPEGLNVLHHCDNRPCCNPAHLWLGTQRDNLLDMVAKGRHGMQVKARMRREMAA